MVLGLIIGMLLGAAILAHIVAKQAPVANTQQKRCRKSSSTI